MGVALGGDYAVVADIVVVVVLVSVTISLIIIVVIIDMCRFCLPHHHNICHTTVL